MSTTRYVVTRAHSSDFPEPITLARGAPLVVGERYSGPEGWDDWYFCETPGQAGGWVPAQVIDVIDGATARARENYAARELDVRVGETLVGTRTLNGWAWCERTGTSEAGWVPLANLREIAR